MFYYKLLSIIVFISVYCNELLAHSSDINWWRIGNDYSDNPAMGWHFITFFIFLAILSYFTRNPLREFLKLRSEKIKTDILGSKKSIDDANSIIYDYKNRLKNLDQEIISMRKILLSNGESHKKRLMNEADKAEERIKFEVISTIKAEAYKAKVDLRNEAIKSGILFIEKELKSNNIELDNEAFSDKFLSNISQLKERV